ncbi:aminotransferase [Candidatus Tenderia electrophaga]|jgi:aspartate/methionine/tyrosine aminotransferase|uniref:Aminotransferase n=1 Tax=Candidatus Tenderia electrophaga TaxID=1748243 RepID=A0A0S2TED4_9GAMM|nr:aminotransferase [Candidatus Tenderia electrophaga]
MAERAHLAERMTAIEPFHVMALLARARALEAQGRDIVHMEIGEPDFDTPAPIVQAGIEALQSGCHHYTPASGLPQLRQAISGYYRSHYGVAVDPERIIITPGSSGALQLLMTVLINPGEQVLMSDPGYPCNRNFVRLVEGNSVAVAVDAASGFQLSAAHLQQHWSERSKAVICASPANPTGTLIPRSEMQALAEFVAARGGHLLVDEIYHGLTYESKEHTALAVSEDVFVINSFSKFFGMTGWRLGWLVAPPAYVEALDRVAQNIFLSASAPAQYAALAAFQPATLEILERRRQTFRQRRDFLLPALLQLGFGIPVTPQGAFYLYADCSRFTDDSYGFALRLLDEAGVAITPGKDFGFNQPERYVRFAYTTALERLEQGVERLQRFIHE